MKKLLIILLFPIFANGQIVAAWRLNGNSNDGTGTLNGTDSNMAYVNGIENQCGSFASKGNIKLGIAAINPLINGASSITVSFWVNYSSLAASDLSNLILAHYINNNLGGTFAGISGATNTGKVWFRCRADGGTARICYSATVLSANVWYNVVGIVNYAGDAITIYINGVLDNSAAAAFTATTFTPGTPTITDYIGAGFNATYFTGKIDNLTISKGSWSVAQIKNMYSIYKGFYQ